MRNRTYDEDFNLDCVKYYAEHLELSQAKASLYLSTIMDLFSRKIIAWELSRTMEKEFVINTVEKAKIESFHSLSLKKNGKE